MRTRTILLGALALFVSASVVQAVASDATPKSVIAPVVAAITYERATNHPGDGFRGVRAQLSVPKSDVPAGNFIEGKVCATNFTTVYMCGGAWKSGSVGYELYGFGEYLSHDGIWRRHNDTTANLGSWAGYLYTVEQTKNNTWQALLRDALGERQLLIGNIGLQAVPYGVVAGESNSALAYWGGIWAWNQQVSIDNTPQWWTVCYDAVVVANALGGRLPRITDCDINHPGYYLLYGHEVPIPIAPATGR